MKNRTILIGLDGGEFYILNTFIKDGVMPFLKGFIESGVHADLRSVIPVLTPPAWTSLMTGRSPGHHGIMDFFRKESEEGHSIRFNSSQDVKCEMIWSMVNRHGLRATSLNYPLMLPPPPIDGNVMSGGWMTWRQLRLACHPDGLYDRVKELPDFNPRELAMDMSHEAKAIDGCEQEEIEPWLQLHIRREQHWFNILRHLMETDPCELTAIMFDGVDKIQHLCWRFMDPLCRDDLKSPREERIRDLCTEYFRQIDKLIAEIVDMAGPDATVVLASDHGFGMTKEIFYANAWLEQNGYLAWADSQTPQDSDSSVLGMDQLARHVFTLDWDRTRAYASTPSSNGIYIEVDTSNNGKGVPAAEYHKFRDELSDALRRTVSPQTGEPVVAHIWTREEAFDGPYKDRAPDLTLALRDCGLISILASDTATKPRKEPSGTHRPEGIFIARGPGIREGEELPELSILDVAPMLLYSLGLPIPEDLEGRMPTEAFTSSMLEERPVNSSAAAEPVEQPKEAPAEQVYDQQAEEEVLKALRALGYIE